MRGRGLRLHGVWLQHLWCLAQTTFQVPVPSPSLPPASHTLKSERGTIEKTTFEKHWCTNKGPRARTRVLIGHATKKRFHHGSFSKFPPWHWTNLENSEVLLSCMKQFHLFILYWGRQRLSQVVSTTTTFLEKGQCDKTNVGNTENGKLYCKQLQHRLFFSLCYAEKSGVTACLTFVH